jgi:hypothetical protein
MMLLQTVGLLLQSLGTDTDQVITYYWRDYRSAVIAHMREETKFFYLLPDAAAATHLAAHAHILALHQAHKITAPDPGRANLRFVINLMAAHTSCPEELLLIELMAQTTTGEVERLRDRPIPAS